MNDLLLGILSVLIIYISVVVIQKISDNQFLKWTSFFQKKLKLSDAVAGETIQALGTSAPEIFVSIIGLYIFTENPSLGLGTIIGSAIFQITVVIGIPLLFIKKSVFIDKKPVIRSSIIYMISVCMLLFFIYTKNSISYLEVIILSLYHILYIIYIIKFGNISNIELENFSDECEEESYFDKILAKIVPSPEGKFAFIKSFPIGFFIVLFSIGIFCISLVKATEFLGSDLLGFSMTVMALTVLAAGTSIPELASNIPLAKQGKINQIIGNAVGSNTLDICISFALVSVPYALYYKKIMMDSDTFIQLLNSTFLLALFLFIFIFLMIISRWKVYKWQGFVLIFVYILFVFYNFFML